MGKSIYELLNSGQSSPFSNFVGRFQNFQQNFMNFANQVRQSGVSPEQTVRELLNSGRMTQEQFNQFSAIANQLTGRK